MRNETKKDNLHIRLSKRENFLLNQMSKNKGLSKSTLLRRALFRDSILDEPQYTNDEIATDKKFLLDKLEVINKRIINEMRNLPLAERESIKSMISQIEASIKSTS